MRLFKSTFSFEDQKNICLEYTSGKTTTYLSEKYICSKTKILNVLKINGIITRNKSQNKRRYSLNESVFKNLNECSLYWLGFMAADGNLHIDSRGARNISLGLHRKDESHINKIMCFFETDKPPYYYESKRLYNGRYLITPEIRMRIISKVIFDDICSYGITPCKTFTMDIDSRLMNRHFFRGLFDGDGSIYSNNHGKDLAVCIVGNKKVLLAFKKFIENNIGISLKLSICKSIYRVRTYGYKAIRMLNFLYNDSNVYLDRKYICFKQWKKEYEHREIRNISKKYS